MCHALADYGATLILASRNIEKNKQLCSELTNLYKNQNIALELYASMISSKFIS